MLQRVTQDSSFECVVACARIPMHGFTCNPTVPSPHHDRLYAFAVLRLVELIVRCEIVRLNCVIQAWL
jgi:hypothetical protein